jgi:hypothetical protein
MSAKCHNRTCQLCATFSAGVGGAQDEDAALRSSPPFAELPPVDAKRSRALRSEPPFAELILVRFQPQALRSEPPFAALTTSNYCKRPDGGRIDYCLFAQITTFAYTAKRAPHVPALRDKDRALLTGCDR